tara:strand:- start:550 stop:1176 length:627 start_codon:yes stop_codon:yes gene_type:complete
VCLLGPDKNAAIRAQAQARQSQREFDYQSKALKFHNKETSYVRGKNVATIGLSRARSDAYYAALHTQGKGRQAKEALVRQYAAKQKGFEGGRSRQIRGGRDNEFLALLAKQSNIENTIHQTFGRNMAIAEKGMQRQYMNTVAKNRESLGIAPSEFGPPTMMPPRDRGNPLMNLISFGASMVNPLAGLGFNMGGVAKGLGFSGGMVKGG